MIHYLSGRDTDDLLMVLEGLQGVVIKRSAERQKRKQFEKGARKDSMGAASGTVFLQSGMGGQAIEEVRELVVEGMREKQIDLVIKGGDREDVSFSAPLVDQGQLRALAEVFAQHL